MKKKKLLWVSEIFINTGFARVSESLLKYLNEEEGYEITVLDTYRAHPLIKYDNYNIIGKDKVDDYLAVQRVGEVHSAFDKIFIIQDIWNIQKYLKSIKAYARPGVRLPDITVYFPIDAPGHNAAWYSDLDIVENIVTYTNFGKAEVESLIYGNVKIIPHGVDTEDFHKLPGTRNELRRQMFDKEGRFDDKFIFLNANRNQPRKRLDITMEAFALFAKDKPDVMLYMHSGATDNSMDLYGLGTRYNINDKLMLSTNQHGIPAFSKKKLNLLYNCCNVGVNSCMAEGWGLVSVEHAITGAAQIVPAHTATKEIFGGIAGLEDFLVKCNGKFTFDNVMTVGELVSIDDMAAKMQKVYQDEQFCKTAGEAAMIYLTSPRFHWKNIAEQWKAII